MSDNENNQEARVTADQFLARSLSASAVRCTSLQEDQILWGSGMEDDVEENVEYKQSTYWSQLTVPVNNSCSLEFFRDRVNIQARGNMSMPGVISIYEACEIAAIGCEFFSLHAPTPADRLYWSRGTLEIICNDRRHEFPMSVLALGGYMRLPEPIRLGGGEAFRCVYRPVGDGDWENSLVDVRITLNPPIGDGGHWWKQEDKVLPVGSGCQAEPTPEVGAVRYLDGAYKFFDGEVWRGFPVAPILESAPQNPGQFDLTRLDRQRRRKY